MKVKDINGNSAVSSTKIEMIDYHDALKVIKSHFCECYCYSTHELEEHISYIVVESMKILIKHNNKEMLDEFVMKVPESIGIIKTQPKAFKKLLINNNNMDMIKDLKLEDIKYAIDNKIESFKFIEKDLIPIISDIVDEETAMLLVLNDTGDEFKHDFLDKSRKKRWYGSVIQMHRLKQL